MLKICVIHCINAFLTNLSIVYNIIMHKHNLTDAHLELVYLSNNLHIICLSLSNTMTL